MQRYVIRGGSEGRARLSILADVLRPSTLGLFRSTGMNQGMHALDLGCGGGNVTLDLGRIVGAEGGAVGIDIDGTNIEAARREAAAASLTNVAFHQMDVHDFIQPSAFDRVYARFLLTHLEDPARIVRVMIESTRPGGAVMIEDIDHSGIFTYPDSPAVARYVRWYNLVVRSNGGDPEIGPKLPGLLLNAGLRDIGLNVVHPTFIEGDAKQMHRITLENIADSIVAAGIATKSEIEATIAEIDEFSRRPDAIVSLPRIFQVWGYRM